jgi:hypothetical protein
MSHTTKEKLHMLLSDIISAEDHAKAIEIAKTEEEQFGTHTDLLHVTRDVMDAINELAQAIDRLDGDVDGIVCSIRQRPMMPDHFNFPSIRP